MINDDLLGLQIFKKNKKQKQEMYVFIISFIIFNDNLLIKLNHKIILYNINSL